MFDQLLSSCLKLSTTVVTGELWGSKMLWPASVEVIEFQLDSCQNITEILGGLYRAPSLEKLTLPFPEVVKSCEDYI